MPTGLFIVAWVAKMVLSVLHRLYYEGKVVAGEGTLRQRVVNSAGFVLEWPPTLLLAERWDAAELFESSIMESVCV
jgi:hypothetical protein